MEESAIGKISMHLEFLGYQVDKAEDYLAATHPTKPNVLLRDFLGGILHRSVWSTNDLSKSDRAGFLEHINNLNKKAGVVRYYADDDGDVVIEAWYPNQYDRARYARFLEIWDVDLDDFTRASRRTDYLR